VAGLTPFQTVGPYFQVLVGEVRGHDTLAAAATQGTRVSIHGVVYDGAGTFLADALVEIWQADAEGSYRHPDDPRAGQGDPSFTGFGRAATSDTGSFTFATIKPGRVPGPDGQPQAPHVLVSILARGVLTRYITRLYFEDEASNAGDPILALVPAARRHTLIAQRRGGNAGSGDGAYQFDIRIQGPEETVFFDV
jgi:protocatechuate 3,4-dioxygenase alpha subunit